VKDTRVVRAGAVTEGVRVRVPVADGVPVPEVVEETELVGEEVAVMGGVPEAVGESDASMVMVAVRLCVGVLVGVPEADALVVGVSVEVRVGVAVMEAVGSREALTDTDGVVTAVMDGVPVPVGVDERERVEEREVEGEMEGEVEGVGLLEEERDWEPEGLGYGTPAAAKYATYAGSENCVSATHTRVPDDAVSLAG